MQVKSDQINLYIYHNMTEKESYGLLYFFQTVVLEL